MNPQVSVHIPERQAKSYPIYIEQDIISKISQVIEKHASTTKCLIISDSIVSKTYGEKLKDNLLAAGYQVKLITFPAGETNKSAITKLQIEEEMFAFGCDRNTVCIALGGGVVGDMVGFTAATYMRGIRYIQVPTSLLAMIDSSVGGKTAINTSYGKNIIGAFWQPVAVVMDTDLLQSLPREHIINGFFEAIKIFLTLDKDHVLYSERNLESIISLDKLYLLPVLKRAVELKAHVVEVDEHERNLRMILNFGHTVGHALEKLSNYEVLHGYCIAYGMLAEAKIAVLLELLSVDDYNYIASLLARLGVDQHYFANLDVDTIIKYMRGDKKNTDLKIKLVLLNGIGSVKNIDNQVAFFVEEETIRAALIELKKV